MSNEIKQPVNVKGSCLFYNVQIYSFIFTALLTGEMNARLRCGHLVGKCELEPEATVVCFDVTKFS